MKKSLPMLLLMLFLVSIVLSFTACGCNHSNTVIDWAVDATCTKSGLTQGRHCADCGEVLVAQEIIAKKSHNIRTRSGKPATCQSTGLTDEKYCSMCGYVSVKQTIIPKADCIEGSDGYCKTCKAMLNPYKVVVNYVKTTGELSDDCYMSFDHVYGDYYLAMFYYYKTDELSFSMMGNDEDGTFEYFTSLDYDLDNDKQSVGFILEYLSYGCSDYATGYIYKSSVINDGVYIYNFQYTPSLSSSLQSSVKNLFTTTVDLLITSMNVVFENIDANLSVEDLGFVSW